MARLTAPNGAVVSVSDEKVERLLGQGYTSAAVSKATSKRASSRKSEK